jgi:hypothetical protein
MHPTFKKGFSGKQFGLWLDMSYYVLKEFIKELNILIMYLKWNIVKHFTLRKMYCCLAKPLILRGKWCVQDFRRVKNNTSNLRPILIFSSEKKMKKMRFKFKVIRNFYTFQSYTTIPLENISRYRFATCSGIVLRRKPYTSSRSLNAFHVLYKLYRCN